MATSIERLIYSGPRKYTQQTKSRNQMLFSKLFHKRIETMVTIAGERESAFTADVADVFFEHPYDFE